MTAPTISLVTICWNAEKTLPDTLESVLAQTALPQEYLFVDGGSTDRTRNILEDFRPLFESRGCAVRLLEQHRAEGEAGIPSAWNQALSHVTGEIVALLNADDTYTSDALETVRSHFTLEFDALSVPVAMDAANPAQSWLFVPQPLTLLPWKMPVPHPGTFFRRRVYERIGHYDPRYRISADYDFIWRCRLAKVPWRFFTERPLVHMRLGGLANSSRALARRETYQIARRYSAWYDLRPLAALLARKLTCR